MAMNANDFIGVADEFREYCNSFENCNQCPIGERDCMVDYVDITTRDAMELIEQIQLLRGGK